MLNKALADPSISWLAALEPPERLSSDAMTLVGVDAEGLMSIALRMESGALAYGIGPQPLEPVPASGLRVLRGNARSLTTVYGGGTPRVTHVPLDQPDASYTQYVEGEAPQTIGWVPFGVPYTSLVDSNGLPNELPGGCGCAVLRSTSMSTRKVFAFVALIALVWVRRGRRRWMPCTMAGYRA